MILGKKERVIFLMNVVVIHYKLYQDFKSSLKVKVCDSLSPKETYFCMLYALHYV